MPSAAPSPPLRTVLPLPPLPPALRSAEKQKLALRCHHNCRGRSAHRHRKAEEGQHDLQKDRKQRQGWCGGA